MLIIVLVGKFRPRLIELISFKLKLLIRFIMNKPCLNKQTSLSYQYHAQWGIVNKIRYDDLGKLVKQTSFTIKNLGEAFPKSKLL